MLHSRVHQYGSHLLLGSVEKATMHCISGHNVKHYILAAS